MGALQQYLKHRIQAVTGVTSGVLVWALLALVCAPLAGGFSFYPPTSRWPSGMDPCRPR
jgi:hypothetical protein